MDVNEARTGAVKIKGIGERLWVRLDPAVPVDELRERLKKVFAESGTLANGADVVLDAGDRAESSRLIEELGPFMLAHFPIKSLSASYECKSPTQGNDRRHDILRSWRHRRSEALVIGGRVRSGQTVDARRHLLLLGDVNPGATVSAGGDIIVLGSLCGSAIAGQPNDEASIVLALDFRPTKLQIGSVVAVGEPPRREHTVEFARIEKGLIVVQDYLQNNPFGKMPWPEVR